MIRKSFLLLIFLAGILIISNAQDNIGESGCFAPIAKSMAGLEDLHYVKSALSGNARKSTQGKFSQSQAVKAIKNAGTEMGFTYTGKVQELLDFYTSDTQRGRTEIMLGLSVDYLPLFEAVLKKENMPLDLMYLPMALSSLNTKTTSAWGATGLWQIMFTNGKIYNLQIDSYVDERRDPGKSTRSAVAYLKDLYAIYLDWELTIAAYSNSPASVNKAIRKAGGSKKYDDLYPFLPIETRDYLPAFTACYILARHYDQADLNPVQIQIPNFTTEEPVLKRMHLGQVADALDIPLALVQDMNPEYKSSIIPSTSAKILGIKLPEDRIQRFRAMGDSIYSFNDTVYFPRTKRINIVTEVNPQQTENNSNGSNQETNGEAGSQTTNGTTTSAPKAPENKTRLTYTVKEGDNLGAIAGMYHVGVSEIKHWNNLRGDVIKVGQKLDIYVSDTRAAQYKGVDQKTTGQKQSSGNNKAESGNGAKTTQGQQKQADKSTASYTWHTVKSGETLSKIASKYDGVTADEIISLNKIKDPKKIQPGQKLKIPKN
jgi:membrane-bound lytic murein transglycosylase D